MRRYYDGVWMGSRGRCKGSFMLGLREECIGELMAM